METPNVPGVVGLSFYAKGKRGVVYKGTYDGEDVVVKVHNPTSEAQNAIANEANFLSSLNDHGIGPKLHKGGEDFLIMEFIDGTRIDSFVLDAKKPDLLKVISDVMEQCFLMDSLGVNKFEMQHPYKHIIVRHGKAVLLDFERCRKTQNPKNLTQFCQYLKSSNFGTKLLEAGIIVSEDIMESAKNYKNKMNEVLLNEIADYKEVKKKVKSEFLEIARCLK